MGAEPNATMLPESLNINAVESLASLLSRVEIGDYACGVLDGSKVETITTPAIQMLIAFHHTITLLDGTLKLVNPSNAMIASMRMLGLEELLNKWRNADV